ncbi:cupin domain-containing protein [Sphingomonas sp. GB1N7]|uniref:cupin domain-containing protein n=1 Tax=Parasphingomonas caseinilytica TaxID=3096158 RepID=UPI002FC709D3
MLRAIGLISAVAIVATAAVAQQFNIVRQAAVAWGPAPDTLPKGAQFALIAGDPVKPGPFAFRLKMPPGYVVMPHTHPAAENITVISGRLYHGMGRTFQKAAGKAVAQGDFVYLPPDMPHSVWTTNSPAVIQVNGTGPFTIKYIRPQDDPRNARK